MGNIAATEMLIARWTELVSDPSLHDLPYKLELNEGGKIEMSPASNRHAIIQLEVGAALREALPAGRAMTECSVLTHIGVRVPDVAWASREFLDRHGDDTPFTAAPELCVEIVSPSNSSGEIDDKVLAYLTAGAQEVWVVNLAGEVRIHGAEGTRAASAFGVTVEIPPPLRRRG